jgi:uroporphyrinogen III methyltransferase/synthase
MSPEILVIREKDRFSLILIEQGFSVMNFPVIKTEPLEDLRELENCLQEIENFDGIFITSSKAAEIVLGKLNETKKSFQAKFYVLGKRSNDLLKAAGLETFFSDQATTAAELLELIPDAELRGKKFLSLCGNRSLRIIPERVKDVAEIKEVIVYKTVATMDNEEQFEKIGKRLKEGKIAAICFFSPSGVEGFLERFTDFSQNSIKVAAIGQTTARFAGESQLRVDLVAAKPTAEDFALELTGYLRKEV